MTKVAQNTCKSKTIKRMNNRLSRFIWILSPLLLYHVHNAASDSDTFVRFCQAPANYGKGKLEGTTKCTVTYSHKQTKDDTQAENFCTQGTPYRITSFTKGKPTICVYEKDYSCEAHEEDIGENCFLVHEKEGPFDPDACPDGYDLHVFEDRGELKWCTGFGPETNIRNTPSCANQARVPSNDSS
ncbi:hypothetical protein Y032_0025g1120 [Ancylostoma ceylanicum]|uniref:Uncharacterized protein n=1 Tax=Ancylostoma ceylanicum TaxID=53326 RepID=A0A016UV28_9BILA|nr:hypothetical protein Y032_0025g1120 [Ancylostoma ceylanicum]